MSKYDPLKDFLKARAERETPMTFSEVEEILGFDLPPSARQHPAWWSNNVGTHVNARAWREAGWKTSGVQVGSERVTFVREEARPFIRDGALSQAARADIVTLPTETLSRSVLRMIDDWADEAGLDRSAATAAILEAAAAARRRSLLESLAVATMPAGHDSTTLIREDRDGR